jgi:predicted dehydrogenase
MSRPLELVLIGAGQRGAYAYASYARQHPDEVRFVGVAEPDPIRRQRFADEHDLDDEYCVASWEELIAKGQLGQGAIVTTQDQMHVEPAVAAMKAGYHVLLEKPMAHTLAGCIELVQTAERTGRVLQCCATRPFGRRSMPCWPLGGWVN